VKQRRKFLIAGGVALAGLFGGGAALAARLANPCKAALPPELANHELVQAAWEELDPAQVWDAHTHLIGVGDGASGCWANPRMDSLLNPLDYVQKLFFMNAGCAHRAPRGQVDAAYAARLRNLVEGMRPGFKMLLFAFDWFHDSKGQPVRERSTFHTPDTYAAALVKAHPDKFSWAASIHPYRQDALDALENAVQSGAKAIKWLPAAMNIDPSSPRCDAFYDALAKHKLPLITHAGEEKAARGDDLQHLGNPLLLRRALERGGRVVVAHCASLGEDRDLDRGANGPWTDSLKLFARLMDEPQYRDTLYADISALPQINRTGHIRTVLEREDWHPRLLNGSDYPLPGVMPLFSTAKLARLKLLDKTAVPVLDAIREHNPLLYDFVLKRHLNADGKRFPHGIFETRRFFERNAEK